jgi:hypothetical protein
MATSALLIFQQVQLAADHGHLIACYEIEN